MTIKTAQKKLQVARIKERKIKKEINDLKKIIKGAEVNQYHNYDELIARNIVIYKRYIDGLTFAQIGREHKRSGTMIGNICKRINHILEKRKGGFEDYKVLLGYRQNTNTPKSG